MDLAIVEETFGNGDRSWAKSRLGFDQCRPGTLDLSTFDSSYYAANGYIPSGTPVAYNSTTGLFEPHDPPTTEVQTITITGSPTGGNYTLASTLADDPTATINHNASAATVQSRLEAILGEGNVVVTGSTGGPYTVTYAGDLAEENVPALTVGTNSLTGGSSPGVTIATGTAGGADDESGQTLEGLLFNDVQVKPTNTTGRAGFALFWMGVVDRAKLPFAIPSTSEADVPHIRFEGEV
jgi:hypothetical protein